MKKGILTSAALVLSLAALTGCTTGTKTKTLTCKQTTTTGGFTSEDYVKYTLKDNVITTATKKDTVKVEGDYVQYLDEYKTSAKNAVDEYNKLSGFSAKVDSDNSSVTVTVTLDKSKMTESDITTYSMNESYESMKDKLTANGYTCE